ncbi:type II toxin-antitoxin system RelE/ParE family toxin [Marinomonas primoryensis]|nr:type II toxin-antitoxin system RelE/ParE family toxin [Marinomonas primoryensis]
MARVLFFFKNNELILLHGFMKKSKKTPKSELDLAKKRKREAENG